MIELIVIPILPMLNLLLQLDYTGKLIITLGLNTRTSLYDSNLLELENNIQNHRKYL
jgi:hypothetical protein